MQPTSNRKTRKDRDANRQIIVSNEKRKVRNEDVN